MLACAVIHPLKCNSQLGFEDDGESIGQFDDVVRVAVSDIIDFQLVTTLYKSHLNIIPQIK